jgi:D-lactate dehydrogenase (cytochrome)
VNSESLTPPNDPSIRRYIIRIVEGTEIQSEYSALLTDESRLPGCADTIAFPACEEEVCEILRECNDKGEVVTTSAARTGITGGAVPQGGMLLSLARMNRILGLRRDGVTGDWLIRCQPGVILSELQEDVSKGRLTGIEDEVLKDFRASGKFIYPPDPTEGTAMIGGTVACNASGARSFHYGSTRNFVNGFRLVLADGRIVELNRGQCFADSRGRFELAAEDGSRISGELPQYDMPNVKNAAGYFAHASMDMVDLFIGAEGTLGVFTELELRLVPSPERIFGTMIFLPEETSAIRLVRLLRGEKIDANEAPVPRPLAVEFFDFRSIELLRCKRREVGAAGDIPEIPSMFHTAIYTEFGGKDETVADAAVQLAALLGRNDWRVEDTWVGDERRDVERLKTFRHAVPESINHAISERQRQNPSLTKLGTDMAVPDDALEPMMNDYRRLLDEQGLEYVVFGHIGDNHVHVNILPRSSEEYEKGKALYIELARKAVARGGTVSAEHGIGKLKKPMLEVLYGSEGISQMRELKLKLDPAGILNRGNLFDL